MRVLHAIASFGPGGAERQLALLASALTTRGTDCHVAYVHAGPNLSFVDPSVTLHRLSVHGNHDPNLLTQMIQLIRRLRPDLVQTWLPQMDVVAGLAACLARKPFIVSERCAPDLHNRGWKSWTRLAIGRRASAIIANSNGGLDYWRQPGVRGSLHVVPNCVVTGDTGPTNDIVEPPPERLIIFAGRLSEQKNVMKAIEAFIIAAEVLPHHQFVVFGEGELRQDVEARLLGIPAARRITVRGYTEHLAYWLSLADALVSVSRSEGQPNAVLEAAALGCPLVLSDIPAHREFLDDRAALFCDPYSAHSIAGRIVEAVSDRAATSARVDVAKISTRSLTIEMAAEAYANIYRQVLQ